jgi:hypothetical protein
MKILDKARLIVYRMHERGIEIFLLDTGLAEVEDAWRFPLAKNEFPSDMKLIELDPVEDGKGQTVNAVAMEGDWHDIPSIRRIIKHDVHNITHKIKEVGSELEQGKFVILKEAFKRVLPVEYAMLKELKDVLIEKNVVTNI